jgi:type II secretory pathway pseudopilin PulG
LGLREQEGFSLLEIALGLMLLGMLGGVFLPFLMSQQQLRKSQLTLQHQERIIHSLALYANLHGRLPCPANPSTKGKERGVAPIYCTSQTAVGTVPYRSLGLPEQFAKDGYLNEFTYGVHPSLAKPVQQAIMPDKDSDVRGLCAQINEKERKHFLDVQEGETLSVQQSLKGEDVIAFVLVSHGPSGEGAFQRGIPRRPLYQAGPCKRQNANGDLVFCAKPSPQDTGLFDDRVKWETRYNFASYYMKAPCRPAP